MTEHAYHATSSLLAATQTHRSSDRSRCENARNQPLAVVFEHSSILGTHCIEQIRDTISPDQINTTASWNAMKIFGVSQSSGVERVLKIEQGIDGIVLTLADIKGGKERGRIKVNSDAMSHKKISRNAPCPCGGGKISVPPFRSSDLPSYR